MGIAENVFLATLALTAVASLLLGAHSLKYWQQQGVRWFTGLILSFVVWSASQFFQTAVEDPGASLLWSRMIYVGVVAAVFFFFVFVLEYTEREYLVTRTTLGLLTVQPVLNTVLVWTNPVHHLFWTEVTVTTATMSGLTFGRGPFLWVHTLYSYSLLAGATVLLGRMFVTSQSLYRRQIVALLSALFVPWLANALYFGGVAPVDLTSTAFLVAGVALYASMYRYDFIDLSPVARDTVVDGMREGMFVLDDEERFIDINDAGRRILGVQNRVVVGERAADVLAHVPGLYERYRDVGEGVEEFAYDDGQDLRHYHLEVSPLTNARGETVGRLFVVRDVTERRRRERELERQNEQLEQFASLVSHDLRNPLNVADGYLDLIEEAADGDAPVGDYVAKVDRSHDRMRRIIDDVLTMARQGQTIEEKQVLELRSVAEVAWRNVETGSATLENSLDTTVQADRSRLLGVFENLFRNAVDHNGGSVTIRVGTLEEAAGGSGFVDPEKRGFYVEDDGTGIPEDQRHTVFEAGYTTSEDGTGLGLSIVEQFVEAHGWNVRVTGGSDGGARFEITGTATGEPTTAVSGQVAD